VGWVVSLGRFISNVRRRRMMALIIECPDLVFFGMATKASDYQVTGERNGPRVLGKKLLRSAAP